LIEKLFEKRNKMAEKRMTKLRKIKNQKLYANMIQRNENSESPRGSEENDLVEISQVTVNSEQDDYTFLETAYLSLSKYRKLNIDIDHKVALDSLIIVKVSVLNSCSCYTIFYQRGIFEAITQ
jgi:hypothetical protein